MVSATFRDADWFGYATNSDLAANWEAMVECAKDRKFWRRSYVTRYKECGWKTLEEILRYKPIQ